MINLKNIINLANPDMLDYIITIQGNPVWDYKIGALNTICLISNIQDISEDEYVTLRELRKYIVSSEIPFDLVKLQTEETKEDLISYKWVDVNMELSLSTSK